MGITVLTLRFSYKAFLSMPSFVCDVCQETLKKARLDDHFRRCPRASFSCIDCYKSFKNDSEYRAHISCITEVQKYEKKGVVNKPTANTGTLGNKPVESVTDLTGKKRKNKVNDSTTQEETEKETSKESLRADKKRSTEKQDKESSKKHKSSKSEHHKTEENPAPSKKSTDKPK